MSYITRTTLNLQLLFIFSLFHLLFISSSALNPDGTLLLSFKTSLSDTSSSVFENWNEKDETPCSWTGVDCETMGSPAKSRVVNLILSNAQLVGSLPEDLGLIDHLRSLNLSNNSLNGSLPASLFTSSELQILSLSSNTISGNLPQVITASSLKFLNLSNNALTGSIPQSIASVKSLAAISLKNNQLSGSIPNDFDNAVLLDLSSNNLNGSLPLQFGGKRINYLNLSNNKFSGSIPPEFVQDIPPKATIDLSNNNFAGPIPQHSTLSNQKTDSFAGNPDLCGSPLEKVCTVPSTMSTPPNATTSNNNTTPAIAAIPRTINSSPSNSTAESSQANGRTQSRLHIKPKMIALIVGALAVLGILAIITIYIYKWKQNQTNIIISKPEPIHKDKLTSSKSKESSKTQTTNWSCLPVHTEEETSTTGSESEDMGTSTNHTHYHHGTTDYPNVQQNERALVMVDGETELEIDTLLKASAYILGTSGSGIVYKAVLEDMSAFAVRRIGESGVERMKDFEGYVRTIAKLRHPNLVRVRGFYWGEDEKLLICDYVDNGSLATASYKRVGSSPYHIPFDIRLKIAKGVARGLTYIHDKKHVHGNIKPSNILLTPDMDPVISDLGLHWLRWGKDNYKTGDSTRHFGSKRSLPRDEIHDTHVSTSTHATPVNGFIGCTSPYHAPESLKSLRPSPKWDVYSFGIVLLELITGKVFSDRELGQWMNGPGMDDKIRLLRMTDVAIKADVERKEKAILACFKLGFSCASLLPQKRPTMKDALQVLEKIPCSSY